MWFSRDLADLAKELTLGRLTTPRWHTETWLNALLKAMLSKGQEFNFILNKNVFSGMPKNQRSKFPDVMTWLLMSTYRPLCELWRTTSTFYLQTSMNQIKLIYFTQCVSARTFSLTPSRYTLHSVMLPAQQPDLKTVSVLRQHVTEDRLGAPVFVVGVESRHGVFC